MLDVTRTEKKYDIGPLEMADMKRRLGVCMDSDPHNGEKGYLVRSLYFDTLSDTDFEEKVEGYDERQKIRLRVYSTDAQTAKLEVKEKTGGFQRKRSLILNRDEAARMIGGDNRFLSDREEPLARWLYAFLSARCYRPKCMVEYERCALIQNIMIRGLPLTRISGQASRILTCFAGRRCFIRSARPGW